MAASVAELVAHLRADAKQFTAGMQAAAKEAESTSKRVAAAQDNVARSTQRSAAAQRSASAAAANGSRRAADAASSAASTAASSSARWTRSTSAMGSAATSLGAVTGRAGGAVRSAFSSIGSAVGSMRTTVVSGGQAITNSLSNVSGFLATQSDRLRSFGTQVSAVGAGIRRAMLPLGLVGGLAVGLSLDFEQTMSRIVGLTGTAESEIAGLRSTVMSLAGETAQAPQAVADALYFIVSSGLEGSRAIDALTWSAKASTAGLGEMEVVADALTSVMNAYASTGMTAEHATDVLTATVREGKIEASELTETIGRVLPMASEMGITFSEVGANLAAMSLKGLDAAEATTALRGIMSQLISPSQQANDLLAGIGMTAGQVRDSIAGRGLLATLIDLNSAFGGNIDQLAILFPEVRGMTGVLNLLNGDAQQATEVFQSLQNSAGAAGHAFGSVADDEGFRLKQAFADLKEAGIAFGDSIAPALATVASAIAAAVRWFDRLPGPIKTGVLVVGALVGAIALLTPVVGAIATGISGLGVVLSVVLSPIGLIIAALVGLGVGLYFAYQKVDWFRSAVQAVWEWMKGPGLAAVQAVTDAVVSAWDSVVAWARTNWPAVRAVILQVVSGILSAWESVKAWVDTNWPTISGIISGVVDIVVAAFGLLQNHLDFLVAAWKAAWPFIEGTVRGWAAVIVQVVEWVGGFVSDLWSRFGQQWLDHIATFISAFQDTFGGIVQMVRGVIDIVAGILTGDWSRVWDGIKGYVSGVWDAIGGIIRIAVNGISGIIGGAMALVSSLWGRVWRAVKGVVEAAWRGVVSVVSAYVDTLLGVWRGVWDAVVGVLRWAWDLVVGRIRAAIGTVQGVLSALGIRIKINWQALWGFVWGVIQQVLGRILGFVRTALTTLQSVMTTAWNAIRSVVSMALTAVWGVITTVVGAIVTAWQAAWNAISLVVSTVWGFISTTVWGAIQAVWGVITTAVGNLMAWWQYAWGFVSSIVRTVWDNIVSGVSTGITAVLNVIRTVLSTVRSVWDSAWSAMKDALRRAVDSFKSIFSGVVSAIATPLNFVIRNVIQKFLNAVESVANAIPGINISLPTLPTIPTTMHSGGEVSDGPGQRGGPRRGLRSDEVIRTLQRGEFVVNARAAKNNADLLHAINGGGGTDAFPADARPLLGLAPGQGGLFEDVAGAVSGLPGVGSILDAARDLIANVARPMVNAALSSLDGLVARYGMPAKMVSGFARRIGEGVLAWIDSADQAAEALGVDNWYPNMGWQAMWDSVHKQFPWAQLHSGLRPGAITATGNPSYHATGRAIDITPSMEIFNWLHDNYMPVLRELIFTPAGARQVHNGAHHVYSGVTAAMHYDHIHAAAREGLAGRVRRPTLMLLGEGAGAEDFAANPVRKGGLGPFSGGGGGGGDTYIDVTINLQGRASRQDAQEIVDLLRRYARENGALPIKVRG